MKKMNFKIDNEKCVHCGMCINDCIAGALEFDENKIPKVAKNGENRCVECQHCLAICPTGALSIFDKDPKNSSLVSFVDEFELANHLKSRRSVRKYKQQSVSVEKLNKLRDILKYSPTGCNYHDLHFAIVEDIETMDKYREFISAKLKKIFSIVPDMFIKKFIGYKKRIMAGEDVIFRNAPHMVVVSTPDGAPCKNIDPIIALSWFELYAESLGLGTCWCGFGQIALEKFPKLVKMLGIPSRYKPSYVMLFGEPSVSYTRTTQPASFS